MNEITVSNIKLDALSIKEEFLSIKEKYSYSFCTAHTRGEMYRDYDNFFKKWLLEDLQYRIIFNDNSITFDLIRQIDKLAIKGILNFDSIEQ